jgi:hypothetical protein
MALEWFEGRTGRRLIARLPVLDGSRAVVHTSDYSFTVTHTEGQFANGYPALSAVVGELPSRIQLDLIEQQQDWLNRQVRSSRDLVHLAKSGCAPDVSDEEAEELLAEALRDANNPPPIQMVCPRVVVGDGALLITRGGWFTPERYMMGVVRQVEIFNHEPALQGRGSARRVES